MEPNALRGETPFPEAGEGVSLRFTNAACMKLQQKFGSSWFTGAIERLDQFDLEFFRYALEVGGQKDDKPHKIDFDTLDVPIADVAAKIVDALFISVHGRTFQAYITWIRERQEKARQAAEDEDPLPSLDA
jgi:hypothetical protein